MNENRNGVLEDFRIEFLNFWKRLPNKLFFAGLCLLWLVLFLFLGNSTLGYVNSPSIFSWVLDAYHPQWKFSESEDGHGIIVPIVVLALFWVKRKELLGTPLVAWWPALVVLGAALVMHFVGYMVQQPRISLVAFFLGLYGIMGVAWGPGWLKSSFFPFILFAFCIPLSTELQAVTFYLRLWVCKMVEFISHYFLAIDIVREGTALKDPTGQYQYDVAPACGGMRSLIATLGLAFCFGFMSFTSWWKRIVMIGAAIPLAILGNLLRMMLIILAAEIGGQEWGNTAHEDGIISMLPYVPAFFGLIYIEGLLKRVGMKKGQGSPPLPPAGDSNTSIAQGTSTTLRNQEVPQ
ncbi:exosortase/archaeosortase family protein [bacterium]|nr:exosortase/archaeosortase family protein [bacterium]